jgi:hypothetical protein
MAIARFTLRSTPGRASTKVKPLLAEGLQEMIGPLLHEWSPHPEGGQ